jgi:hypothetical protein
MIYSRTQHIGKLRTGQLGVSQLHNAKQGTRSPLNGRKFCGTDVSSNGTSVSSRSMHIIVQSEVAYDDFALSELHA